MKPRTVNYFREVGMIEDADPIRISLVNRPANQKAFTLKSELVTEIQRIEFADKELANTFLEKYFEKDSYDLKQEGETLIAYSKEYDKDKKTTIILGEGYKVYVTDPRPEPELITLSEKQETPNEQSTLVLDHTEKNQLMESNILEKLSSSIESLVTYLKSDKNVEVKEEPKAEEVAEPVKEEIAEEAKVEAEDIAKDETDYKTLSEELKSENEKLKTELAEKVKSLEDLEKGLVSIEEKVSALKTESEAYKSKYENLIAQVESQAIQSNSVVADPATAVTKSVEEKKPLSLKDEGGILVNIFKSVN